MEDSEDVRMPWIPKRLGYLIAMGITVTDTTAIQSDKLTCCVISMYVAMHYLFVIVFSLTPIAQDELSVKYCLVIASSGTFSFLLLVLSFVHYIITHSLSGIRRCLSLSLLVVPVVCTLFLHGKAPFYLLSTTAPTIGLYIGHRVTSVAALAVVSIFLTIIGVSTEVNPNLIGGIGDDSDHVIWCDTAKLISRMYIVLVSCFGNLAVVGYFTIKGATVQPPIRVLDVLHGIRPRKQADGFGEQRPKDITDDDQELYSTFFCCTLSLRGMAGLLSGMIFFVTGLCGTFLLRGSYEQNRSDAKNRLTEIAQASTELSFFEANVMLSRARMKLMDISRVNNYSCGHSSLDIAHKYWVTNSDSPVCNYNRSNASEVSISHGSMSVLPTEELHMPDLLFNNINYHTGESIICSRLYKRSWMHDGDSWEYNDTDSVSVNEIYSLYPRPQSNPIDPSVILIMSCRESEISNKTYHLAFSVGDLIWKHRKYISLGDSNLDLSEGETMAPFVQMSWHTRTSLALSEGSDIPLGRWGEGLYLRKIKQQLPKENYVRLASMWIVVICGSAISAWIVAVALRPISKFTTLAHSFACGEQPLEEMNLPSRCFKELILLKIAIYRLASAVLEARHLVHPGALDCLENADDNDIGDSPMSARERSALRDGSPREGGSPTLGRAPSPLMMSSGIVQTVTSPPPGNVSLTFEPADKSVSRKQTRGGLVSQVSRERIYGSVLVSSATSSGGNFEGVVGSSIQGKASGISSLTENDLIEAAKAMTNTSNKAGTEDPPMVVTTPPTPRNDSSEPSSAPSPTNASQGILHYMKSKLKRNEKVSNNNLTPMSSPSGGNPRSPRGKTAVLSLLSHTPQNKDKENDKESIADANASSSSLMMMKKKNKAVRFSVDTKVQNLSPRHALNQVEATVLALNVSSLDFVMKSMKPQACIELFTEVFTFAVNAISESRGTTITISGHHLLALWKCERSLKACECALQIQSYLKRRQNQRVRGRIGISGGRVVWGNFSLSTPNSHGMTVVNVLGQPVIKAGTLERFNKEMNTFTLVDGYVYDKIAEKPGASNLIMRPVDIIHYSSLTSRREYPTPVYELEMLASELLPDDPAREYADGQPAGQFHFEAFRLALREEWEAADDILMKESTPVNSHVARLIQIVRLKREPLVIE